MVRPPKCRVLRRIRGQPDTTVIAENKFGYQQVNVDAERDDGASLLAWFEFAVGSDHTERSLVHSRLFRKRERLWPATSGVGAGGLGKALRMVGMAKAMGRDGASAARSDRLVHLVADPGLPVDIAR